MYINYISSPIPFLSSLIKAQTLHFVKECFIPYHTYFLLKSYHTKFAFTYFSQNSPSYTLLFYFTHYISFTPTKHNIRFLPATNEPNSSRKTIPTHGKTNAFILIFRTPMSGEAPSIYHFLLNCFIH